MFNEAEGRFKETQREFYEFEENKKREDEVTRSEAIRKIEEALASSNVSISELDSSLWSPYGDWKEKVRNSVGYDIVCFSGDMRIAIDKAKRKKNNDNNRQRGYSDYSGEGSHHSHYQKRDHDYNNSGYGQGDYSDYSWQNRDRDSQRKHGDYGNPSSNYFGDKNFSSNNSG